MNRKLPCFITSDRGSNIKAAIASTDKLWGIPCLSHVLHRAVLESLDLVETSSPVHKVMSMAAAFNKSIPRSSHFVKWQREDKNIAPLQVEQISRTRWHGYHDSMIRHIQIQDRISEWIEHVRLLPNNDHLNVEPLTEFLCTPEELCELKSLCYVL